MLSVHSKLHDESPNISMIRPELGLRSGDGSRQRVLITCVPQTKTKTNWPFGGDKKEGGREKEESMFVTLLIIFILCRLVCIASGEGSGVQDEWV